MGWLESISFAILCFHICVWILEIFSIDSNILTMRQEDYLSDQEYFKIDDVYNLEHEDGDEVVSYLC